MIFLSMNILSASGVVGPLAPSAMICENKCYFEVLHFSCIFSLHSFSLEWHNTINNSYTLKGLLLWLALLTSDLGFDIVGVFLCKLFFTCSRDQDMTVSFQDAAFIWGGVGEANNSAIGLENKSIYYINTFRR